MRMTGRIVSSAIAAFVGAQAAGWLAFIIVTVVATRMGSRELGSPFELSVSGIASVVGAIAAARYVWMRTGTGGSTDQPARSGLFSSIVRGALITGAIGFALGFFGPMIFAPGANQGPMLGIFITGPLGLVVGAIGGGVVWARRGRAIS